MKARYIEINIEATGLDPSKYSMISLGACVIGKRSESFYAEMKPVNHEYSVESMKIACQGLHILAPFQTSPRFNPYDQHFSPSAVLWLLEQSAEHPIEAMMRLREWLKGLSKHKPLRFVSDTNCLGWRFVNSYFSLFGLENPFDPAPLNALKLLNDRYEGIDLNLEGADLPDNREPPHNALQDALYNSSVIEYVFRKNPALHAHF